MLRTAKAVSPAVLVALLLAAGPAGAADDQPSEANVFRDNTQQVVTGAATLAGAGCQGGSGTAMVLALIERGDQQHLWRIEASDHALPLSPRLLKRVMDDTGDRIDDSGFESEAYCEAVYKASLVSLGALANSAHDATFRELWNKPGRYRGDVIHYEGKLRSVRDFDAPLMLSGKFEQLYECWIFEKDNGANPVCLICSELPTGVKPAEHLSLPVAFDAYFFKLYKYQSVDSAPGKARKAPQFIGRSFVLLPQPRAEDDEEREAFSAGSKAFLLIFLGGALATVVLALTAHWWFHRADRRIRARINVARTPDFPEPSPPAPPSLPPAEPSANLTSGG
jgi:hypothetical protein